MAFQWLDASTAAANRGRVFPSMFQLPPLLPLELRNDSVSALPRVRADSRTRGDL